MQKTSTVFYGLKTTWSVPKAVSKDLRFFYGFDDNIWKSEPTCISEQRDKTVLAKKIFFSLEIDSSEVVYMEQSFPVFQ